MNVFDNNYNNLDNYLLDLIKYNQIGKKGLPIIFKFSKGAYSPYMKILDDGILIVSLEVHNNTPYLILKPGAKTIYNTTAIPIEDLLTVEIHPDYNKKYNVTDYTQDRIIAELLNEIPENTSKKIVFEFSNKVYLPGYSILPKTIYEITTSVLTLSSDKGRTWKKRVIFYIGKSKSYYNPEYFPFDNCIKWSLKEDYDFKIKKNSVKTSSFKININTAKTREIKSITISSDDEFDNLKTHEHFPLALLIKFENIKERTDENCLICGTKLNPRLNDFVHLLNTKVLTKNPLLKIENHFQFFPVGSECKQYVPEEYIFTKEYLRDVN